MILQSLVSLYEKLAEKGEISELGYCLAKVSYALRISESGELLGIVTLKETETRGKKSVEVPKELIVPEQYVRSVGIKANFLCDNAMYLLGLASKGDKKRASDCFYAAKELHLKILKDTDNTASHSLKTFFESWNPDEAEKNEIVAQYINELMSGVNIVFMTDDGYYIQNDYEIKKAWSVYKSESASSVKMQCLVTGKDAPVAVLHNKIKGVQGAQSAGANLIGFNANAYESYGCNGSQGLNAPVSEYAMFAYTTALNHLIADRKHRKVLGDTTIVYWAENAEEEPRDCFNTLNDIPVDPNDEKSLLLDSVMKKAASGKPLDFDKGVFDTKFYILGISPNAARISVRFFYQDKFSNIIQNVLNHYQRLEIEKPSFDFPYLTPFWLLKETVSPNSRDQSASPLLSGAVMSAIFTDGKYPESLFNAVISRIRAEHSISSGKAAIIKAFLLKKYENNDKYKEELGVSLNEDNNNKAYVLGRLFAVLERTQEEANDSSNIRESFFNSACATPGIVFPILLKKANHHISKINRTKAKTGKYLSDKLTELMKKLDDEKFPTRLTLEEQGIFIKGYYHQVQDRYVKRTKDTESESE